MNDTIKYFPVTIYLYTSLYMYLLYITFLTILKIMLTTAPNALKTTSKGISYLILGIVTVITCPDFLLLLAY